MSNNGTPSDYIKRIQAQREEVANRAQEVKESGGMGAAVGFLHAEMDTLAAYKLEGTAVSCRKGCSFCCRIPVYVTEGEAELLAQAIEQDPKAADLVLLARQEAVGVAEWASMPTADRVCAFLDKGSGECRVYAARPLACRSYYVVTDPARCDTVGNPGAMVGKVDFGTGMMRIGGALIKVTGKFGMLPKMVMAALEMRARKN